MSRRRSEQSNFWPGYVDALVNIVLNILFMVGLMAVGLVSLNVEALGNFRAAKKVSAIKQISEDYMLLASLGTLVAAWGQTTDEVVHSRGQVRRQSLTKKLNVEQPIPQQLSTAGGPVKIVESPVDVEQEINANSIDIRTGVRPVSDAELLRQITSVSAIHDYYASIPIAFAAYEFSVSESQGALLSDVLKKSPRGSAWQLSIFVLDNEHLRREAFWRLNSVRRKLIELNVPPQAISMRTFVTSDQSMVASNKLFVFNLP